jgi:hypothetical protein
MENPKSCSFGCRNLCLKVNCTRHYSEKPWVQKGIYNGVILWHNTTLPTKYDLVFCWPTFICQHRCCDKEPIFSLANSGTEERKQSMYLYAITARTLLQEADEADKKGPITGTLTFEIQAVDWATAADAANELLPETYNIVSVSEIGLIDAA